MILAGDIGGTNTRIALFECEGSRLQRKDIEVFPSKEYGSLDDIVNKFMASRRVELDAACFGVAGPVKKGRSETSNLPWKIDAKDLAKDLNLDRVVLSNDLEVNAYGIAALEPSDFVTLSEGDGNYSGNSALIAAGTGLGEAGLHWQGEYHQPFPSEGGHTDFGPRTDLEVELLCYLWKEFERVSYERVLSGPGLHNIYRFLRDTGRGEEPEWLREQFESKDPPVAISQAALSGMSPLCEQALNLIVEIYGAEAGNLALTVMATGGVYVGGGIAPKIVDKLKEPRFMEAFHAKGRMRPLLETIPVKVVMNDKTALLGAARVASLGDKVMQR